MDVDYELDPTDDDDTESDSFSYLDETMADVVEGASETFSNLTLDKKESEGQAAAEGVAGKNLDLDKKESKGPAVEKDLW